MEEPPHICYASVVLLAVTTQASEPLLDGLCSRRHCEGVWLAQKAHQIPDHPLQLANVTQEFPGVKGGAGWGFVKLHKVRVHRIGGSTIAISHLTSGRGCGGGCSSSVSGTAAFSRCSRAPRIIAPLLSVVEREADAGAGASAVMVGVRLWARCARQLVGTAS